MVEHHAGDHDMASHPLLMYIMDEQETVFNTHRTRTKNRNPPP